MKTDNALRAVLEKKRGELPYGFEYRVMRHIQREAERIENRRELLGLVTVMLVSISFLAGVYKLLKNLLHIDVLQPFAALRFPSWHPEIGAPTVVFLSRFSLCLTILLVMLVLLSLDGLFRRKMRKRHMR